MVLIAVGTGIGSGIIIDGALYRGASEASGEIGHMIPGREFLGKDYRDFGSLESVASGTGIRERASSIFRSQGDLASGEKLTAEQVFEAARQKQGWACRIIDETVDYLAIAISNLSVSFDPELIVLGGGVTNSADLLVEPILRRISGMIPMPPRLVVSDLGLRATVMGAVVTVLHNTSNFYLVRKLS
jgi:predicted NBD/HSP70 family sugar kinase